MAKLRVGLLAAIALVLLAGQAMEAATVRQFNLEQMVDRAGQIFRGTVLEAKEGTVQAGGGELPVVTYRIRVDEALKGEFQQVKGQTIAEIRMIGKLKSSHTATARRLSTLPVLVRLEVGQDYLLLATPPSAAGLSTTVGVGQGSFQVFGKPGQETAVNAYNNQGLFRGMSRAAAGTPSGGPVPYPVLADLIRDIVE
jgi:hypothetical protein